MPSPACLLEQYHLFPPSPAISSIPTTPCHLHHPCRHLHQYHLFPLQIPAAPAEKDKGCYLDRLLCYCITAMLLHHCVAGMIVHDCITFHVTWTQLSIRCYKRSLTREGYENTRDENQRQRVATRPSWLSSASRRIKATSPPAHHSSDPSPPKLLEETEGRRLEGLRLPQEAEAEGTRVLEATRPLEPTARPLPSLNFLALA